MSEASKKFIIKILIFTVVIYSVASLLFSTILESYHFKAFPYLILLIVTVTTAGHLWVVKASGANTMKFTTAFMASVTLKLMVYLFFMLIYLLIDRSQAIPFVLTFITLYILFTVFEVIQILGIIKK